MLIITVCLAGLSGALPNKTYLPVPFLCQAPYANWSQPWQDACEEVAIIMAMRYVKGDPITRKSGNQEILDMVNFQIEEYGLVNVMYVNEEYRRKRVGEKLTHELLKWFKSKGMKRVEVFIDLS